MKIMVGIIPVWLILSIMILIIKIIEKTYS